MSTPTAPAKRVLIAEDNATARQLIEKIVRDAGYDVIAVSDGIEAWQEMQKPDAPKLLILDCMMPRMDGLKVVRGLRERPDAPYVYILLVTARSRVDEIVEGLEAGADDYMVKPFEPVELAARLGVGERILTLEESVTRLEREKATLLMAATLGHEINNPLAVIMPNIEFLRLDLKKSPAYPELSKRIDAIEKASLRIHDIANRLRGLQTVETKDYLQGVKMLNLFENEPRDVS